MLVTSDDADSGFHGGPTELELQSRALQPVRGLTPGLLIFRRYAAELKQALRRQENDPRATRTICAARIGARCASDRDPRFSGFFVGALGTECSIETGATLKIGEPIYGRQKKIGRASCRERV